LILARTKLNNTSRTLLINSRLSPQLKNMIIKVKWRIVQNNFKMIFHSKMKKPDYNILNYNLV
jgi:hypothetical protein